MQVDLQEEPYSHFSARLWGESWEKRLPLRAQLELTYRCNLHCVHCYTDPFNRTDLLEKELHFEDWLNLFDQLASAGILWITFTGGEAAIHPRFRELYAEAKKRGFILSLFTNATVITESLADFLAEDPPFTIEVSLHGADSKVFDRVTQVSGSFRYFDKGIRKLIDRNLPLEIKTKAMSVNRGELQPIADYVKSLGLKQTVYTSLYPRLNKDTSSLNFRLTPQEIMEIEYGTSVFDVEKASCTQSSKEVPDRMFRCGCGTNSLTIDPYGYLRPCTFTIWPKYDLKKISLPEAFKAMTDEINAARYGEDSDSPCRRCPVYDHCDKNPAMAVVEVGTMAAPVPYRCDIAYAREAMENHEGVV